MDANKDQAAASATPQLIPSSSSCSSTSSCSCDDDDGREEAEVFVELRATTTEVKEEGNDENVRNEAGSGTREGESDNGVDDGYHTPKSPEHRIPASLECPMAPKKSSRFQYLKRKSMVGGAEWSSRARREIVFDLSVDLDGFLEKNKKARRETATAK